MTIGKGIGTLTRQYQIDDIVQTAAAVSPGESLDLVQTAFDNVGHDAHAGLAARLFRWDADQHLVDDEMLRACRGGRPEANLLVWTGLVLADRRLADIVETVLTRPDGKIDANQFNSATLRATLDAKGIGSAQKAASNILRYFETAGLVQALRQGSTIVGIEEFLPTSFAVPAVVAYMKERVADQGIMPPPDASPIDLGLGVGANHWMNLTPAEFRQAAHPRAVAETRTREDMPAGLEELDNELRRKRQVVLQGPPGVGKTFVARRYIAWLVAGDPESARLTTILETLPSHERTAERVVDEIEGNGLLAVWDLVQFHPSYSYEDFVRSLVAEPVAGGVTFTARDKVLGFIAALGNELRSRSLNVEIVLVIDEINRGDISKVFGELIYALEYRNEPVTTPYAVEGRSTLRLPAQLLLIGTMNTADRSIALIDYALRRRFVFLDLVPDRSVIQESPLFANNQDREAALTLFDAVAELFVGEAELKQIQVGHSYFLPDREQDDATVSTRLLSRRFAYEVFPLLLEYEWEGRLPPESVDGLLLKLGQSSSPERPRQAALNERTAEFLLNPPST